MLALFFAKFGLFYSVLRPACITLTVALITAGYYWWKRPRGFPPGPRGIPVLGVIPWLGAYPERVIKKWSSEKYGRVMCARMGSEDRVFLNTAESIKKAFVGNGKHISGRPTTTLFKQVTGENGIGLKQYGEDYKTFRSCILRELYSCEAGKKTMEEHIIEEAGLLADFLKNSTNKPINLKIYLYVLTSNIINRIISGSRYEFDDQEYRDILINLQKLLGEPNDATLNLFTDFYPGLKYLPWFRQANNTFIKRSNEILAFARKIIDDHKEVFDKNCLQDLTDKFIYEQQHGTDKNRFLFRDEELVVVLRDLLSAGSETSSNTITWMLILLLHNPKHMQRVVNEIDDVMGPNGVPGSCHKDKMPFTCAVIQETMRCKTVVPTAVQHCATATLEVEGYIIPKGTLVYANIWGAHNDPVAWPDPSKFDPYRHIDKDGNCILSNNIIPFSVGLRSCPGEQLARQEIFIFVTKILQKFKLSAPENKPLPSLKGVNCLQFTPLSCELVLTER